MDFNEVIELFKKEGTEQKRNIYKRHGASQDVYGVSFKALRDMAKSIKVDHELAMQLWETNNSECQILSTMILDQSQLTKVDLDNMVSSITYYTLLDEFTNNVVSKSKFINICIDDWVNKSEYVSRAAYNLIGYKAMHDRQEKNVYFIYFVNKIKDEIHNSANRTKQSMLNCLIAIGSRNDELEKIVLKVNKVIGEVYIDHQGTSCSTPNVEEYIKKTKRHRKRK